MLHLRYPYEMGGAYWLFNMAYTQVSMFVALSLGSMTKEAAISVSDLGRIAVASASLWALSILMLVVFSENWFKHTFYQPTRAWEYNKTLFDTGLVEYRMFIFDDHRKYYHWYEEQVKEWLGEVWNELHHTKPAWFTEEAIRSVPIDLIPHMESIREEFEADEGGGIERMSSSVKIFGDAFKGAIE